MRVLFVVVFVLLPISLLAQTDYAKDISKKISEIELIHPKKLISFEIYDPFKALSKPVAPIVQVVENHSLPNLNAIVNSRAFLNRKWYKVGQSIGIYMIVSISDKKVVISESGKLHTLIVSNVKKMHMKVTSQ